MLDLTDWSFGATASADRLGECRTASEQVTPRVIVRGHPQRAQLPPRRRRNGDFHGSAEGRLGVHGESSEAATTILDQVAIVEIRGELDLAFTIKLKPN